MHGFCAIPPPVGLCGRRERAIMATARGGLVMPSDPAVPIPGSGPDEEIAPVRSPERRRWLALRRPDDGAVRTLHLLLIGSILAPLLVLLGGGYLAYERTLEQPRPISRRTRRAPRKTSSRCSTRMRSSP